MVSTRIYRSYDGGFDSFESHSLTTGTQRGKSGAPRIDNNESFYSQPSLKLLANHLITYVRLMKEDDRWQEFQDKLDITFPRDIKIFHPLGGVSRILLPLTEKEVREFWKHLKYYSHRREIGYEL